MIIDGRYCAEYARFRGNEIKKYREDKSFGEKAQFPLCFFVRNACLFFESENGIINMETKKRIAVSVCAKI